MASRSRRTELFSIKERWLPRGSFNLGETKRATLARERATTPAPAAVGTQGQRWDGWWDTMCVRSGAQALDGMAVPGVRLLLRELLRLPDAGGTVANR